MSILKRKISDFPLIPGVEREVEIYGAIIMDSPSSQFVRINYIVNHTAGGKSIYIPYIKDWELSNSDLVTRRDENFEPIVPEVPEEGSLFSGEPEQETKVPAFDYLKEVIASSTTPLMTLLENYIDLQDSKGFFNEGY